MHSGREGQGQLGAPLLAAMISHTGGATAGSRAAMAGNNSTRDTMMAMVCHFNVYLTIYG